MEEESLHIAKYGITQPQTQYLPTSKILSITAAGTSLDQNQLIGKSVCLEGIKRYSQQLLQQLMSPLVQAGPYIPIYTWGLGEQSESGGLARVWGAYPSGVQGQNHGRGKNFWYFECFIVILGQ